MYSNLCLNCVPLNACCSNQYYWYICILTQLLCLILSLFCSSFTNNLHIAFRMQDSRFVKLVYAFQMQLESRSCDRICAGSSSMIQRCTFCNNIQYAAVKDMSLMHILLTIHKLL